MPKFNPGTETMGQHESKFTPAQEAENNIINIGLKGETETDCMLSNFAHTPFELDGVYYESVEGFWQSIKFPEGSEDRVKTAALIGGEAKKAGKRTKNFNTLEYQGQTIEVGSPEHHALMKRAIKAKLEQNPQVLKLLLDTGNKQITHILKTPDGRILPDSKTIPGAVFSQILMDLREAFKRKNNTPTPVLLAETPQVGGGYCLVHTKEQLKEIVELPLLAACEELYEKNIRTIASSANKKDIEFGQANIMIDFDTLSEENKAIARKFAAPEKDTGHWGGGQILLLMIPVSASSTVKEISQQALAMAKQFKWQPAVWIPKRTPESFTATIDQLKEGFYLESPEYDDPNSAAWKRLGYDYDPEKKLFYSTEERKDWYYDPKTNAYYPSEELYKKANQKQPR